MWHDIKSQQKVNDTLVLYHACIDYISLIINCIAEGLHQGIWKHQDFFRLDDLSVVRVLSWVEEVFWMEKLLIQIYSRSDILNTPPQIWTKFSIDLVET